jgi:hypothetical protein
VAAVSLLLILTIWYILGRLSVRSFLPYLLVGAFLAFFGGPCWFVASHHWLSALFCMISLALLLPPDECPMPSLRHVFASGIFSAAAALTLQHRGGLWIIAATVVLLLFSKKRAQMIAAFYGGILLLAVPVGIYFLLNSSWDTLYYDLITFPMTQYGKLERHGTVDLHPINMFRRYAAAFAFISKPGVLLQLVVMTFGLPGMYFVYLLPAAASVALGKLFVSGHENRFVIAMLTAAFIAAYLATLHRLSDMTLFFASATAILPVSLALARTESRRALMVLSLLFIATAAGYSILQYTKPKTSFSTPAGVVQTILPEEQQSIATLLDFSRRELGSTDRVFCYPYIPIYYFLFRLNNPSRFDILTYPMHTLEQMISVTQSLEQTKTRWVIVDTSRKNRLAVNLPLERYLIENYEIRSTSPFATILERRQAAP